ncbi:MAG: SUMF1/EgtB/PvdO family nonheme iron enzyme [Verrucomicrobia bacterium]|nr:SUMF1/EgtB/PvdO family nonheme iron enzyme [Verrucomicrobiota bacterium]
MAIGDFFQPQRNDPPFLVKFPLKEHRITLGTDISGKPVTIVFRTADIKEALDAGAFKSHLNASSLNEKVRLLNALFNNPSLFEQTFNEPLTTSRQTVFQTHQPPPSFTEEATSQRMETASTQTREEPPAEHPEQLQSTPAPSERASREQRLTETIQEESPSRTQDEGRQQEAAAPPPGDADEAAPSPAARARPLQLQGRQTSEPASSSKTSAQGQVGPSQPTQIRSTGQQTTTSPMADGQAKGASSQSQPSITPGQSSSSDIRAQQRTPLQPFLQQQAQSGVGSWGFSNPQQVQQLISQVRLLLLLFGQTAQQGSSFSLMQSIDVLHSLMQMSQQLGSLQDQMKQVLAEQGVLAGDGAHELNAFLASLSKQLDEHESLLQQTQSQTDSEMEHGKLPGNPMTASLMLKERCDKLLLQAKDAAMAKVDSTLAEKEAALARDSSAKEGQAPTSPNLEKAAPPPSLSQPKAAPATPGMKEAASNVQRQQIEVRNKLELRNLPQNIQNNGIKPPILVSLAYPIENKIQTPTKTSSGSKGKSKEKEDDKAEGGGGKVHQQQMVFIPEGPMILGDPFSQEGQSAAQVIHVPSFLIAASCVTNGQFADWLNEAFAEKKIRLGEKGLILDNQKNVICATQVSSNSSQIHIRVDKGTITFDVLPGGELNPIVQVSWHGALAYCADNGLRLPSEAEWEKAAGMQPQSGDEPLVKFRFGIGKNEIDPTWANYRSNLSSKVERFPRQINFYNGNTQVSLQDKIYTTHDARSPYGCYDMCGNVRQWVNDGENDKIAKGGSYLTPEKELEVAARSYFDPSACMADVGFRVAIDA